MDSPRRSARKMEKEFFPIFVALGVLAVSLSFYSVFATNTSYVDEVGRILGAATQRVLNAGTLRTRRGIELETYKNITFESGDTAYDFLIAARNQTNFQFEADRYDFGWYIHTINNRRALNNEYWKFVINGQDATINVDKYTMVDGDVIEFELVEF